MPLEDSREISATMPERIMRSRYAMRWKPVDTADGIHHEAKVRWIMIGFDDPDVLELEGASPCPQLQTINTFLAVSAGLRQEVFQGDLEEAFLQGKKTTRLVYVKQPPEGVPGLHPDQLLKMGKEVYGTVRGSASWRESLVEEIKKLEYEQSCLDPCLFILRASTLGQQGSPRAGDAFQGQRVAGAARSEEGGQAAAEAAADVHPDDGQDDPLGRRRPGQRQRRAPPANGPPGGDLPLRAVQVAETARRRSLQRRPSPGPSH